VRNRKEINDFNYLDDLYKQNPQYFSTTYNINIPMKGNYNINQNDKYKEGNDNIKQISMISITRNNKDIESYIYLPKIYYLISIKNIY